MSKPQPGCGGGAGVSGYAWKLPSLSQVAAPEWDWALPVCSCHAVVSGRSLRSRFIVYLSGFWAGGHLCSFCSTSYSLQPAFLDRGYPLHGFCADLGPPLQMLLTVSESCRCYSRVQSLRTELAVASALFFPRHVY